VLRDRIQRLLAAPAVLQAAAASTRPPLAEVLHATAEALGNAEPLAAIHPTDLNRAPSRARLRGDPIGQRVLTAEAWLACTLQLLHTIATERAQPPAS
jgi:hypothetical protein